MKFSKLTRIYTNLGIAKNQILTLRDDIFHYCTSVLRMKLKEEFRIFNEIEGEFLVQIIEINKKELKVVVTKHLRLNKVQRKLTLAIAIIKPDRFIEAIKSAVQLGVTQIIPIISERTQYKNINKDKIMKCIIESTEQSERLVLPLLKSSMKLQEFSTMNEIKQIIFANENEKSIKINTIQNFMEPVAVFIGPEGGFSDNEQKLLLQNEKVISVTLGETILRSEVAVTSIIACVNLMRG